MLILLLKLFWEFFKVGLFSIGGGLATVPFLYSMSASTGWFTTAQLADMIAVSESTPGPMGVNMATYVGFTTAKLLGAVTATLGLVAPSIIVILIIARVLEQFRSNKYVENGFYGLRPASTGLIAAAGFIVCKIALLNLDIYAKTKIITDLFHWKACLLALCVLVFSNWVKPTKNWHPVIFIAISAVVGVVFHFAGV